MNTIRGLKAASVLMVIFLCSAGLVWSEQPLVRDSVQNLAHSRALAPTLSPADAILAVLVTDLEVDALAQQDRIAIRASQWTGPFRGHDTRNLQVLSVLNRRIIGAEPFDLLVTFKLPDGSTYQKRVIPVDPASETGLRVFRPDVAPQPIRVTPTKDLGVLSRVIPSESMGRIDENVAVYAPVSLPVSGTWITQHNLYGVWSVEVSVRRNREILSTQAITFELIR